MNIGRIQTIALVILIPLGLLFWYLESQDAAVGDLLNPGVPVLHIGAIPIRVEIADSTSERTTGLSGRKNLNGVNGLLFVFPEAGYHAIWMKDMLFAIDIIWISEDLTVIGVEKGVTPDTYPDLFRPPAPAKYVLETEIHYTDTFGIRVGQKVKLPAGYLDN